MNLREYTTTVFNIEPLLPWNLEGFNYIKSIEENDDLPYDAILPADGELRKVVYLNDQEYIAVLDLISYTDEEIEKSANTELKEVYKSYMDEMRVDTVDILNAREFIRRYKEHKQKRDS